MTGYRMLYFVSQRTCIITEIQLFHKEPDSESFRIIGWKELVLLTSIKSVSLGAWGLSSQYNRVPTP